MLLVTNSGFQGCVGGRVVLKKPVVVAPKFQSFLSHIFTQASQNITVKVRVDCSVRWNNPLHLEKTMSVLFVELQTYRSFFCSW
jgi:hypothetical protein